MSFAQIQGRTRYNLPFEPSLPLTLGSSFSVKEDDETAVAISPASESPFDVDSLQSTRVAFFRSDGNSGTYVSDQISRSNTTLDDLNLSLGVAVGNRALGGSVSGSYEKSILDSKQTNQTSRRVNVRTGAVRFTAIPALSAQALEVLEQGSDGYQAFCEKYGHFYVSSLIIGGEAAVTIMSAVEAGASIDKVRVQGEVHFLCFSTEGTLAAEDVESSTREESLGIVAFDTLTQHLVNMPLESGQGMRLQQARELGLVFNEFVQAMPDRVGASMAKWPDLFKHHATLTAHDVGTITRSGLVTQLAISPWETHRQVRSIVVASSS